jgi:hypothetical protein
LPAGDIAGSLPEKAWTVALFKRIPALIEATVGHIQREADIGGYEAHADAAERVAGARCLRAAWPPKWE